jgi:hypothetical protein
MASDNTPNSTAPEVNPARFLWSATDPEKGFEALVEGVDEAERAAFDDHPLKRTPVVGTVGTIDGALHPMNVVRVEEGPDAGDWFLYNHKSKNYYRGLGSLCRYHVYLANDTEGKIPVPLLKYQFHNGALSDDGEAIFRVGDRVKFVPLWRERMRTDENGQFARACIDSRTVHVDHFELDPLVLGIAVMASREDEQDLRLY